jgi:adenylate kinase
MLRAAWEARRKVRRAAQEPRGKGVRVPDWAVLGVAEGRLRRPDASDGWVLDDFPRTVVRAEVVGVWLAPLGSKLEGCRSLGADPRLLVEPLLKRAQIEGRSADHQEAIPKRMRVDRERTQPRIDYHRRTGVLAWVDGLGGIDEIAQHVEEAGSS